MYRQVLCFCVLLTLVLTLPKFGPTTQVDAAGVTPDDDVNGTYVQQLFGTWVVDSDTTLSDEIIEMNGDIIINSYKKLRLKNVTIIFNVTKDQDFGIRAYPGSTLEVYDNDNDISTTEDGCYFTDTIYDTDDWTSNDFTYFIRFDGQNIFKIRNSVVEEFGKKSPGYWDSIDLDCTIVELEGTTFRNAGGIIQYASRSGAITTFNMIDCTLENSKYPLYIQDLNIDSHQVNFINNTIKNASESCHFWYSSNIDLIGNKFHNISNIHFSDSNNILVKDSLITNTMWDGLDFQYSNSVQLTNVTVQNCQTGVNIGRNSYDFELENVTVINTTYTSLNIWDQCNNIVVRNSTFKKSGEKLIYLAPGSRSEFYNVHANDTAPGWAGIDVYGAYSTYFENLSVNGTSCAIQIQQSEVSIANSSITDNAPWDYDIGYWSTLNLINTSYDMDNVILYNTSSDSRGYLNILNFLQVNVTDVNGLIYGATVEAYDKDMTLQRSSLSDFNGQSYFPLMNKTFYENGIKQVTDNYGPYTVKGIVPPDTQVAPKTPSMATNDYVDVIFPIDTVPAPPIGLEAALNSTNIELNWDVSCPDYSHFLVYKNTTAGYVEVYNSTGQPDQAAKKWNDVNAAVNQSTYRYLVSIVDLAFQEGGNSNWAQNGDWVVSGLVSAQDISGLTLELNGSITVIENGDITLTNMDIYFNNTEGSSIVVEDGTLTIKDTDGKRSTTGDNSYITTTDPNQRFGIEVKKDGQLIMKNTQIRNLGKAGQYGVYTPEQGIYLESDWNWFVGCSFYNCYLPIMASNVQGLVFRNNTVGGRAEYGLRIIDSTDIFIQNNTMYLTKKNAIYSEWSTNVHISNNTINHTSDHTLYLKNCQTVRINGNDLSRCKTNYHFMYLRSGTDYYIYNNYIHYGYESNGIYLSEVENHTIHSNVLEDVLIGIRTSTFEDENPAFWYFTNNTVFNNTISGCPEAGMEIGTTQGGYYFDNTVDDCKNGMRFGYLIEVNLRNNHISNCQYGLNFEGGEFSASGRGFNMTFKNNYLDMVIEELGSFEAINCIFNRSRVLVNDISELIISWLVNVTAFDYSSNLLPGADLTVKNVYGNPTFNSSTNANGRCNFIPVMENIQRSTGNFTQNPNTFELSYGNHKTTVQVSITGGVELNITLTNEIPTALNVEVGPSQPTTQDDLLMTYLYTDPEADIEGQSKIHWYCNGERKTQFDDLTTVGQGNTQKGQVWFCTIIPNDGISDGIGYNSSSIIILNTKPAVDSIDIGPTNATSSDELQCAYNYQDVDQDPEVGTIFKWYRYNSTIPGLELEYTTFDPFLEIGNVMKGENWTVGVTPYDGEEFGEELRSSSVYINNTPPVVQDVSVTPPSPTSQDNLTAEYTYFDLDNDVESNTVVNWYVDRSDGNGFVLFKSGSSIGYQDTFKGEKWKCSVTPNDGTDPGSSLETIAVSIGNTPPTVADIQIIPTDPYTESDLSVTYSFNDLDGDKEVGTIYEWEKYNVGMDMYQSTNVQSKTLLSHNTKRGDSFRCKITPNDGDAFGEFYIGSTITILNSLPQITLSGFKSLEVSKNADIVSNYHYTDADNDLIESISLVWYKNGERVQEFDNAPSIPKEDLTRGQIWYYTLQVADSQSSSELSRSPNITVKNALPYATGLDFQFPQNDMGIPYSTDEITIAYDFVDADNDTEDQSLVKWYRNNEYNKYLDNNSVLNPSFTKKGDFWYYSLVVHDGSDLSGEIISPPIEIGNSPPQLINRFPEDTNVTIQENVDITFSVNVYEPDNEPLRYSWVLNNEIVSQEISFKYRPDNYDAGTYQLNLSISDLDDRYPFTIFTQWEVTVENVNRLTHITDHSPEDQVTLGKETVTFRIDYTDLDEDDEILILWYFDDEIAQRGKTSFTYYSGGVAAGDHVVRAEVDDGYSTTSHTWNVTIETDESEKGPLGLTWDAWGIIVQGIVIILSISVFIFGIFKLRKKQTLVSKYLDEMKIIYTMNTDKPDKGLKAMNKIYKEIINLYEQRKITDSHFLILERNHDDYIALFRKGIIMDVDSMNIPDKVKSEIDSILLDGKVTPQELAMFRKTIETSDMSSVKKQNLISILGGWVRQDRVIEHKETRAKEKAQMHLRDEELDIEKQLEKEWEELSKKQGAEDTARKKNKFKEELERLAKDMTEVDPEVYAKMVGKQAEVAEEPEEEKMFDPEQYAPGLEDMYGEEEDIEVEEDDDEDEFEIGGDSDESDDSSDPQKQASSDEDDEDEDEFEIDEEDEEEEDDDEDEFEIGGDEEEVDEVIEERKAVIDDLFGNGGKEADPEEEIEIDEDDLDLDEDEDEEEEDEEFLPPPEIEEEDEFVIGEEPEEAGDDDDFVIGGGDK